jgi:hypothetical protein
MITAPDNWYLTRGFRTLSIEDFTIGSPTHDYTETFHSALASSFALMNMLSFVSLADFALQPVSQIGLFGHFSKQSMQL